MKYVFQFFTAKDDSAYVCEWNEVQKQAQGQIWAEFWWSFICVARKTGKRKSSSGACGESELEHGRRSEVSKRLLNCRAYVFCAYLCVYKNIRGVTHT